MTGEKPAATAALKAKEADDNSGRQRSKIGFPYMDLNAANVLAEAIHTNVGLGDCDDDQLAAWTDQSSKSSSFRVQIGAARMFGVISAEGSGKHKLTDLGRMVVDPSQAREGKARAFLTVPLYKVVYEKYRGGVLPPAAALERDMVVLGVAEKQKDKARQVFERSATQAGFFEHGKNKLVMPPFAVKHDTPHPVEEEKPREKDGGGGPPDMGLHPFIQGLLKTLPEPDTEWAAAARAKWLQTAANIFDLIYKGDGGITVTSATAPRSPRPGDAH